MSAADESGLAAVVGTALIGLLLTVAVTAATVVGAVDAHRRAQSAADLAALAAGEALAGAQDACGAAAAIARRNGARLDSCVVQGTSVAVQVLVSGPRVLGLTTRLPARVRAGPVTQPGWVPRSPSSNLPRQSDAAPRRAAG